MEMNWENYTPKHLEAPGRRRWKDCVARGWVGGDGDEGESCQSKFLKFPENFCTPRRKQGFTKTIGTNAFIDSYYPKLQSDCSVSCDEGGKYLSSREMLAGLCVGDSSECSNIYVVSMAVSKKSSEVSLDQWEEDAQENRSRTTVGTKTYTLFSNSSEIISLAGPRNIEEKSSQEVESPPPEEESQFPTETKVSPTHDWFNQLLARIDTLETLLHQTLGAPKSCETGTTEVKDNFDTDNELRNIKERVNALEKKLRETGIHSTLAIKSGSEVKETSTTNTNLTPVTGVRCRSTSQVTPTESDSAALRSPKSDKAISQPPEKKRTKTKKKSLLHSKKMKRISSSVLDSSGKCSETNSPQYELSEDSLDKIHPPHQIDSRPVDPRPTDSRTVDPRPADPRPTDPRPVDPRPVDPRPVDPRPTDPRPTDSRPTDSRPTDSRPTDSRPTDSRPTDPRPADPRPADPHPETEEDDRNLKVVFIKPEKRTKITGKKRKELCRKPPVTNFAPCKDKSKKRKRHKGHHISESQEEETTKVESSKESVETPIASTSAERNRCCRIHFLCKRCPPHVCHGCPHWRNNNEVKKSKTRKKIFPNPIEILKRGGQIKIPVLFKEVCKVTAPEEGENTSNISIRFIPINESKHPFKKLLKKLRHDSDRKFVCDEGKCCCENEIPKMNTYHSGRKKGSKRRTCD